MMVLTSKSLAILFYLLSCIYCQLADNEFNALQELSIEWGIELNNCSSDWITCSPDNTTVHEMFV